MAPPDSEMGDHEKVRDDNSEEANDPTRRATCLNKGKSNK